MNKPHKITIAFDDKADMLAFADEVFPDGLAVYHADGMDREFTGSIPKNSYVVRRRGAKPDPFLADRPFIGAAEDDDELDKLTRAELIERLREVS